MKKKWISVLSLIFVFVFAIMFSGCMGVDPDRLDELEDQLENGEITEDEFNDALQEDSDGVKLDGVLVLRKPLNYDFDNNVVESNYYNSFAEDVLTHLFYAYGSTNYQKSLGYEEDIFDLLLTENEGNEELEDLKDRYDSDKDDFVGFYDAIRYQITNVEPVKITITGVNSGVVDNPEGKIYEGSIVIDGVNYLYSYNGNVLSLEDEAGTFYSSSGNTISIKGVEYTFLFNTENLILTLQSVESIGTKVTADDSYAWSWSLPYDQASYEAWIYAYGSETLDEMVEATFNNSDENFRYDFETFKKYYNNDFEDQSYRFVADTYLTDFVNEEYVTALEYAIYRIAIGLTPADITVSYGETGLPTVSVEGFLPQTAPEVKSSVQVALESAKEDFYKLGTYVGLTSTDKQFIVDFILEEIIGETAYSTELAQNTLNYEVMVEAIVNYAGTLTTTGMTSYDVDEEGGATSGEEQQDDEPTYVGDAFTASEVALFPYTTFFSSATSDDPFVNVGGPFEYQSFVLLPSDEQVEIGDIWLDMKYDAGNDGDSIVTDETLTMTVILRYVKVQTDATGNVLNRELKEIRQNITLKDGPHEAGEEGSYFEFELDANEYFGETVKIGKFAVPDVLQPDKTEDKTNNVVTITGETDARKYYEVLESGFNNAGSFAVLDSERFNFSYFEVAFDIEKEPGNRDKNYAFYCSILNLIEPPEYPNDPVWQ